MAISRRLVQRPAICVGSDLRTRVRRDAFGGCFPLFLLKRNPNAETNRTFVGRDWVQQRRQVEEEINAQRLASEANGSFFVYCMCQMYSVNIVF